MLKAFFTTFPLSVCIVNLLVTALGWKQYNKAQRSLLPASICAFILYFCQAFYYSNGYHALFDFLWLATRLAIYPLFYFYIVHLTTPHKVHSKLNLLLLLPAVVLPTAELLFPDVNFSLAIFISFSLLTLYSLFASIFHLYKLDNDVNNTYSDTEGKSPREIINVFVCLLVATVFSVLYNIYGRDYFHDSVFISIPSSIFGLVNFFVVYYNHNYKFSTDEINKELENADTIVEKNVFDDDESTFIARLEVLMDVEKIYLQPNLKMNDLAVMIGTNRTYLSRYLNNSLNLTFSEYINQRRISHAKSLKAENPTLTNANLASLSGYSSEQAFLMNFKKFADKI